MRPLLGGSAVWLALAWSPGVASAADPTWVFFADRGRDEQTTIHDVAARAAELSPRALRRRQRVRGDGGVDARDLAPAPAHVAAVVATGATLRVHARWLNAISVEATPDQRAAIALLPGVAQVRPVARRAAVEDAVMFDAPAIAYDESTYGYAFRQLTMLGVPFLHDCGLTGAGIVVGVQDSGFSLEHLALMGIDVIAAHDFVEGDDIVADEPGDAEGQHNHGTMVLSLLAGSDPGTYMGAAPGISVILSKTEDLAVEMPFEEDLYVAGLEWIESMGADMFTASLGYLDWYETADFDGQTAVTTIAADIAVQQGLIVFSAIGNTGPGPTSMGAPADAEGVISVGAVDLDGVLTEFSSRGPTADGRIKPNILAPGFAVAIVNPTEPQQYMLGKGTSFAAPLAAGTAALLLEAFPEQGPAGMRALLQNAGTLADMPNNDSGWGLFDASIPAKLRCSCRDDDGDGAYAVDCGGDDCDDADPDVHPGAAEVCDGHDDDCDGALLPDELDGDGDGVPVCAGDCDDADPAAAPGRAEICDGRDNDCDSVVDDACGETPTSGGSSESATSEDPDAVTSETGCGCTSTGPAPLLAPLLLLRRRRYQPT